MNSSHNHISVNNPQIPVFSEGATHLPFRELVNALPAGECLLNSDAASVSLQDIYLPNFSMRKSKGKFATDAVLSNMSATGLDLLSSCLFLKGNFKTYLPRQSSVIDCTEGAQNFKYDPQNECSHRVFANTWFEIIHISANPEYFIQFLPDEDWADSMRIKIVRGERILGERMAKICRAQESALQTIFNCPLTGKLGDMMMETAIVQIILLQLSALFRHQPPASSIQIKKRDLDLIQTVKDHVSKTFLEDHTLSDLAKHFGTNTNKLISLFKKTFGKSIFEYIGEMKMDYAWKLLRDEDRLVTDVARELGYKNPNHFTAAFKRKFGVSPSQVR
jgi:AraC-like DNA-binding protein